LVGELPSLAVTDNCDGTARRPNDQAAIGLRSAITRKRVGRRYDPAGRVPVQLLITYCDNIVNVELIGSILLIVWIFENGKRGNSVTVNRSVM
jgi:hypothetical protein